MSRVCFANAWPQVLQGWVGAASLIEEIVSAGKKASAVGYHRHGMKIKIGSWADYDFDKEDAKIAVPLILLLLGLTLTPLKKEWLLAGVTIYYALYFFLPPCFAAIKKLFAQIDHWRRFRCPYCKSHELILQGMQEFHGDIPYDHYFCHRCRETCVFVNTYGAEKMIAPNRSKLKGAKRTLTP
jgi:hypothetical protein